MSNLQCRFAVDNLDEYHQLAWNTVAPRYPGIVTVYAGIPVVSAVAVQFK
jgi:hypothetical protein